MQKKIINTIALLFNNLEFTFSILSGFTLLMAWLLENTPEFNFLSIVLYLSAYIFGAWFLVSEQITERKLGFNIDLLMIIAAIGAAILGEFAEGGLLLFLFALAHSLEHYALDRARNAISLLGELVPSKAKVIINEVEIELPINEIKKNDIVVVLPSERLPIDGEVIEGESSVDQSTITGESVPVFKKVGDTVFAGTINRDGVLKIRTTNVQGERTFDRIIKLVQEAQEQKTKTEQFTEKFEKIFVPIVLITSVIIIFFPVLIGLWEFKKSFYTAMAFLVGSSPCALALGTPSAVLAGITRAAKNGVLIKGGIHLENLGDVKAIAFDKTGTLTVGKPRVIEIVTLNNTSQVDLLKIAASIENLSKHPLAKAVIDKAMSLNIKLEIVSNLQSMTAKGLQGEINGKLAEVGSLRIWNSSGIEIPDNVAKSANLLQQKGQTIIVVKYGQDWLGVLGLQDAPRENAKLVIQQLRQLGIQNLSMLTGDNEWIGNAVSKEVEINQVHADLLPEDKVRIIKELSASSNSVAMVGDGVNDAPALASATVGISIGGASSAIALETSDIALLGDDISKLPFAVMLSRSTKRVIKQNIFISLMVIVFLAVATISGLFGIGASILLHEGSTMLVLLNSLKLLKYKV